MFASLYQAMREDGYVSYDRYLSRDVGPNWVWQCEECEDVLDDEGNCERCMESEDE